MLGPPKALVVNPDYIRGLIDGDGSLGITFSFREPHGKFPKRSIDWVATPSLHLDNKSMLVLDVFKYYFEFDAASLSKKANSTQMLIRKSSCVQKLIDWLDLHPPFGDKREKQLVILKELWSLKKAKQTQNLNAVLPFLKKVYSIPSSGRQRTYTLAEAEQKAREFLQ